MAVKTPLAHVKEKFGEKTKLVEAVEKLVGEDLWVSRTNKDKGLKHVSNAKLLRLHATFSEVKAKFGTREKLIDAIVDLEKRAKDAGFRDRLSAWPVPRLYDTYKSAAKRQGLASDTKPAKKAAAKKDGLKKNVAKPVAKSAGAASKSGKLSGKAAAKAKAKSAKGRK